MRTTTFVDANDDALDRILEQLPGDIVLGIPLGIGKPNYFVNALYRRIKAMPARKLTIITALSLARPQGTSDLEKRFLAPFVERVFGDYPDLDYVNDLRAQTLPDNIRVQEFFLKTGDYLFNSTAQLNYICTNYTFVARDMILQGVNLIAQAVAVRRFNGNLQISLSSNPDLTPELIERLLEKPAHRFITVGVINEQLPFMPNQALVGDGFFDYVVENGGSHNIFAPPNMKVTAPEYAIGLHASSLVRDGGTLQIGIGALGDAIAHALILRDQHNQYYRQLLGDLTINEHIVRDMQPFDTGLYGCSEMLVNGFLKLIDAGIIKRQVFADATLQHLLNTGEITHDIGHDTLMALRRSGRIQSPLTDADVCFLREHGILKPDVQLQNGRLVWQQKTCSASLDDVSALAAICGELLGESLNGGIHMHGGFFLGPRDFYRRLHELPAADLNRIGMARIDFINQLYQQPELTRAQRVQARFMNTTMMMTLLGAAVSDGLESGQTVSGVGGQYNFVAMAHALDDARSILMLRATREHKGEIKSNIVWNYGHTTIPRHLRDIVITEYGVADLRAQSDGVVIERMLAISDSRFQLELLEQAKANGKIEKGYIIPEAFTHNTPENLHRKMADYGAQGLLPDYPFGTDFTEDEQAIITILEKMKRSVSNPLELVTRLFSGFLDDDDIPERYLERLGLDEVHSLRQLVIKKLFIGNL